MPRQFYADKYLLTCLLYALMKCGDIKTAESIFNKSTEKVLPMYGAMMKGWKLLCIERLTVFNEKILFRLYRK